MSFLKHLVPVPYSSSLRGWMFKQDPTSMFPSWRKRYFIQEGDKLYWYKSSDHLEHLGVASLREVVSVEQMEKEKTTGSDLWKIDLKFKMKSFYLRCETEEEMNYWINGLRNCVQFFQEDWSTAIDDEDTSPTNTEYFIEDRDSPYNSQLNGTEGSPTRTKSHSNPNFSALPTNSKHISFTTSSPPQLIPEVEKKSTEVLLQPPLQRDYLKPKLPWPSINEEKNSIPKIPSHSLTGLPKEEIPKSPYTDIRLQPSTSKLPHLIRFPSTGLTIQCPSITEYSIPTTPENGKIITPELEIKRLAELTEKQTKTINSLLEIIQKGKIQQKNLEEIISEFETKKKTFHLLLETKEEQIRKERQLRFEADKEKTREFEYTLNQKNEQISKLEKRVKEIELELLEKKGEEEKRKRLTTRESISKQMGIDQKQKELEAELLKVKRKYFFTLALNIKISKSLFDMDINALYTRVTEQKIPVDQWDNWILQHAHNKDARF